VEEKLDFTSKTEFQSNPNMVVYDAAEIQRKKEKEIEDERNRNAK
jgi:divalent metal cation (Fe/Co/Zn/Cd) transporter